MSNREGEEGIDKLGKYVQIGVLYYVIYDPIGRLKGKSFAFTNCAF